MVKGLALQGIPDPQKATLYLNKVFIPRYNQKFAVEAEDSEKAWRKAPENLKEILSQRMERKVKRNLTISVKRKILQLKPSKLTIRVSGVKVEVRELFDRSFRIYHPTGEFLPYEELEKTEKTCRKRKFRIKKEV